jgi:serine/threonine protein kinase
MTDGLDSIGPYSLLARLGRGTMGVVYRAVSLAGDEVALKVMLPEVAGDEHARARFLREAHAVSRLRHRNIISVLDAGVHDGAPYIAMELLQGNTLEARLASGEPLTLQAKLDVVIQLCEALQFAHDHGIVHRDVKPANLALLPDGRVKLFDFGVAKISGATHTRVGDVLGSVAYMSPEQLAGQEVDGRADVFSAGAILYELLTGRRPYEANNLSAVINKILNEDPPSLRQAAPALPADVIMAAELALQRDRELRYAQAADFGTDLRLARYGLEEETVDATIVVSEPPATPASAQAVEPAHHLSAPVVESAVEAPLTSESSRAAAAEPPRSAPTAALPTQGVFALAVLRSVRAALATGGDVTAWARSRRLPPRTAIAAAALIVGLVVVVVVLRRPAATPSPAIELTVRSEPPGASIALDGTDTAMRTPATIALERIPRQVRLTLAGFGPVERLVPQTLRSDQALEFRLQRLLRVRSDPPGAQIVMNGHETGQVTPTELVLPDPPPPAIELVLQSRGRRVVAITPAVLAVGEVGASFMSTSPGTVLVATGNGVATAGISDNRVAPGIDTPAPTEGPTSAVNVRLIGGYPFEVSGCGHTGAAASEHTFQARAPCTLRLRASSVFLDVSRRIEASSGQIDIAAPQLARVQMRSRYEWCTLILNGRAVGAPPVDVDLVAGTYAATIQCPDKSYSNPAVAIEPGRYVRRLDELLR